MINPIKSYLSSERKISKAIFFLILLAVFTTVFGSTIYAEFARVGGPTQWGTGFGYGFGYGYGPDGGTNGYRTDTSSVQASSYGPGNGFGFLSVSEQYDYALNQFNIQAYEVGYFGQASILIPSGHGPGFNDITNTQEAFFRYNVNISFPSGSSIFIPVGTYLHTGLSPVDFTPISAGDVSGVLGLPGGATPISELQFGLPSSPLAVSFGPITINMYVGLSYEGQTLNIYAKENSPSWSVASTPTCTVASGICTFTTTSLSLFAVAAGGGASAPTVTTYGLIATTTTSATLGGDITNDNGASTTERGFAYGLTSAYGATSTDAAGPFSTGIYSQVVSGLTCNNTYHYQAYAANSAGTSTGIDLQFDLTCAPGAISPTVTTYGLIATTTTSATLGGDITNDNGASTTERGFAYGLTSAYGATSTDAAGPFSTGIYSQVVSGLTCNNTYHYQAYAANSAGTSTGIDLQFDLTCAPGAISVTTGSASSISTTSATLGGDIIGDGGASTTERGFAYGLSTLYGATSTDIVGPFSIGSYTQPISGLTCGSTYHFEAYAANINGISTGSDAQFDTSACPVGASLPHVTIVSATTTSTTSVLLTGDITSDGGASTTVRGFAYGTTTAYGATSTDSSGPFSLGDYTQSVSGLTCGTTYDFEAFVANSVGTSTSSNSTFTTDACPIVVTAPTVVTGSASSIGQTSVTLAGDMTSNGGENATRGFEYGLTTGYGVFALTGGTYGAGSYTASITSLTCGTTYHYRSVAVNSAGTSTGSDAQFDTSACTVTPPVGGGGSTSSSGSSVSGPGFTAFTPLPSTQMPGCPVGFACTPKEIIGCPAGYLCTPAATNHVTHTFKKNLTLNSNSSDVKSLQAYLNSHGFKIASSGPGSPGHETNLFRALTKKALAKFQASVGIKPATGNFGPATRAYINSHL